MLHDDIIVVPVGKFPLNFRNIYNLPVVRMVCKYLQLGIADVPVLVAGGLGEDLLVLGLIEPARLFLESACSRLH